MKIALTLILSFTFLTIRPSQIKLNLDNLKSKTEKPDPISIKAKIIVETFKHIESGGNYELPGASGEKGAYQILPDTWERLCRKHFDSVLVPTPINQDLVVLTDARYRLEQGYSIEQIASLWNCGSPNYIGKIGINKYGVPYNVPAYVNKFVNQFKIIEKSI
jgi:hypothetical protein